MNSLPNRPSEPAPTGRPVETERRPAEPEARPAERFSRATDLSGVDSVKSNKKLVLTIAGVVAILLIAFAVMMIGNLSAGNRSGGSSSPAAAIDTSRYQAVFFTNGQVYFGKLTPFNDGYMKLTDIFYLQTKTSTDSKNPQQASSQDAAGVELIKLGNEIHGPDDEMIISREQVLFFENLKKDGKVTTSINGYQKK